MRGGVRVIGYHGTSGVKADEILRVGFQTSENAYDWLGTGVYFFEEDFGRAQRWARDSAPDDPSVIAAAISLGNVLDLFDQEATSALRDLAVATEERFHQQNTALPQNRGGRHDFDCMLINLFCEVLKQSGAPVPVVRGLFEEGDPIHANSSIRDLTHIQLAVRDPRSILGMWRMRP